MPISEMIAALQALMAEHGDLQVVTGLSRSGYGEPVRDVQVVVATTLEDGREEKVVEIELDESSTHEMVRMA